MPRLFLQARLPREWAGPRTDLAVQWEITLDYLLEVPPNPKCPECPTLRGRRVGKVVEQPVRDAQGNLVRDEDGKVILTKECDGLRLQPPPADRRDDERKCPWPAAPLVTDITRDRQTGRLQTAEFPLPWPTTPTPFLGGGQLLIKATLIQKSTGTPLTPPPTDLFADGSGVFLIPGAPGTPPVPYTADASVGSERPRIEGMLLYHLSQTSAATCPTPPLAAPSLPDLSLSKNRDGTQGNASVDPCFRGALLRYLGAPSHPAVRDKAAAILSAVGSGSFFRVLAYLETLPGARYAHIRKLQYRAQSAHTKQPVQAAYPAINAIKAVIKEGPQKDQDTISTDGGFGVMQLTNPVPTYSQIWHWRKNIDEAVHRINEDHLPRAKARLALRPQERQVVDEPEWVRFETYHMYNGGPGSRYWRFYPQWGWWFHTIERKKGGELKLYGDKAAAVEASRPPDFD